MSLIVKLAENAAATHEDKITLKAESETIIPARTPIVIPLPAASIVSFDFGRYSNTISLTGIVDEVVTELFVDTVTGAWAVGEIITGTAAWNGSVTPNATNNPPASDRTTPTAIVVAGIPDLTNPTSLIVSGLAADEYFVNDEPITGNITGAAVINEPFPSKQRLEQIARYFYKNGAMTLTTRSGSYSVQIKGINLQLDAGHEDRYRFKIDFAQVS